MDQAPLRFNIVWIILCFCFCNFGIASGQNDNKLHRVFVIGNVADIPDEHLGSYAEALNKMLSKVNDPFTIMYSGDLSNQKNYDKNALNYDSIRISLLLKAGQFPNGRQIIIPGDRDWLNSGKDGWNYSRKLEKIFEKSFKDLKWIPRKGCPGPKEIG